MKFQDAQGKEYVPRITVQVLREYEARVGVKVFETLLAFCEESLRSKQEGSDLKLASIGLLRRLFPTVDAAFFLAYRASLPAGSAFDEAAFKAFCENMGGQEFAALYKQMTDSIDQRQEIMGKLAELMEKVRGDKAEPQA